MCIRDSLICDHLIKKGIVIPPHLKEKNVGEIEGAYVKDPIVGMHKWVVSFDLNSLYPHLIMQYNISPETLVDDENHSWNVKKLMDGEFSEQDNLEETNRPLLQMVSISKLMSRDFYLRLWKRCMMTE